MEFQKLIEERYSVREYQNKPVEQEKIDAILKQVILLQLQKIINRNKFT